MIDFDDLTSIQFGAADDDDARDEVLSDAERALREERARARREYEQRAKIEPARPSKAERADGRHNREMQEFLSSCTKTGQLDMHALEDYSSSFERKPIPKSLADVMRDTQATPLNMEEYKPALFEKVAREFVARRIDTVEEFRKFSSEMQKKHSSLFSGPLLLYALREIIKRGELPPMTDAETLRTQRLLCTHAMRSESGVMVIAVFTSPYPVRALLDVATHVTNRTTLQKSGEHIAKFSCPYDCHYCPSEPGQPRSYLLKEPGVLRANRNNFHCVAQFWDRAMGYHLMGHPVDKIELLVLGGTWSSYPLDYQEEFMRDLFYAANTFHSLMTLETDKTPREPLSIEEEQTLNERSDCRIIGITIETRPDQIWGKELRRLRRFGVTRVQLGVQHTDDDVLRRINRGCTTADAINAFRLLRDCCFKIDMHLMPDLPGASPEIDNKMFDYIIDSEDLQADQWKIYPCEVTPFTQIKQWFDAGLYRPYANQRAQRVAADGSVEQYNPLFEVIARCKARVPHHIRLNRVIRDIPGEYIDAGNLCTNLRVLLGDELKRRGTPCRCIRCRECKDRRPDVDKCEFVVREYRANGGRELFLSYENADRSTLYAFLRLRLSNDPGAGVFPELVGCALVRELHVYGRVVTVGSDDDGAAQHVGMGKCLLLHAARLARDAGYARLAVIAGVGTKEYYRRRGFVDDGDYLIKSLDVDEASTASASATTATTSGDDRIAGEVMLRRRKRDDKVTAGPPPAPPTTTTIATTTTTRRQSMLRAAAVLVVALSIALAMLVMRSR